ncbi:hypothetical protein R1flu_010046 [Riccia fluitans]|uniref:Uncharacterized protein n=1 Tax=Riccia fluitans TaxID=41844 RepID=A0ABD1Z4Z3_9MARC
MTADRSDTGALSPHYYARGSLQDMTDGQARSYYAGSRILLTSGTGALGPEHCASGLELSQTSQRDPLTELSAA